MALRIEILGMVRHAGQPFEREIRGAQHAVCAGVAAGSGELFLLVILAAGHGLAAIVPCRRMAPVHRGRATVHGRA